MTYNVIHLISSSSRSALISKWLKTNTLWICYQVTNVTRLSYIIHESFTLACYVLCNSCKQCAVDSQSIGASIKLFHTSLTCGLVSLRPFQKPGTGGGEACLEFISRFLLSDNPARQSHHIAFLFTQSMEDTR